MRERPRPSRPVKFTATGATDGELLELMIQSFTIRHQTTSASLQALYECLQREEQLLLGSSDFPDRADIMAKIEMARRLVNEIVARLAFDIERARSTPAPSKPDS